VVDVLEVFSAQRQTLTLSEISRLAGLPLSTAHRLVAELTARAMLERSEDGRYRVGLRLWEIASVAPRTVDLREAAMPFLEDLYEATHENVQLAVMDGGEALYVERLSGRDSVHVVTRAGSRLPLHATGVGLVLLAGASHDVREAVLARRLRRYTPHTITDPRKLRRVLADVRRDGYVISDRQIETISVSVAAPVRTDRDGVLAALSIVVDASGADPRTLVPAVRSAAHGIARSLEAQ
jgi:DNA-binding IclR family transcriptional regulator